MSFYVRSVYFFRANALNMRVLGLGGRSVRRGFLCANVRNMHFLRAFYSGVRSAVFENYRANVRVFICRNVRNMHFLCAFSRRNGGPYVSFGSKKCYTGAENGCKTAK